MTLKKSATCQIFIYGSCVSRDTFEFLGSDFNLLYYVARQSFISSGNQTPELDELIPQLDSAFQNRMVRGDIFGNAYQLLEDFGEQADVIVIDLIDERGGVIETDGGYVSKLAEMWSGGGNNVLSGNRHIAFGTDLHFELWANAADRLAQLASSHGWLPKIIVLETPWAERDDKGEAVAFPEWMMNPGAANRLYARYYAHLRNLGFRVVRLPQGFSRTTFDHKWGASPFHYVEEAYRFLADAIEDVVAREAKHDFPQLLHMGRRAIEDWGGSRAITVEDLDELPEFEPGTLTAFTLTINGYPIDFLVEDNSSDTTLVSFHAALGTKQKKLPVFTGRSISDGLGLNRIFISDPSLLAGEDLGLAWFLGTKDLLLEPVLEQIIESFQRALKARHLVFFGMSGGGFAALNFSRMFPGSLAIPVNPQTNVLMYAEDHWWNFAASCFSAKDKKDARRMISGIPSINLCEIYASGTENITLYVQNSKDPHVASHLIPWCEATRWAKTNRLLLGNWGEGHVPPPGPVLRQLLSGLTPSHGDWRKYFGLLNNLGLDVMVPNRKSVSNRSPYCKE